MNKRIFTIAAICLGLAATVSYAQPKDREDWKERFRKEKTEFFNKELNMNEEQASEFWPVYEKISRGQWKAQKAVMDSKEAMGRALHEGKGDFKALLDAHVKACEANDKVNAAAVKQFRKEFGDEFTVRLLAAEEKFRRAQIHRLNGKGGHPGKPGKPEICRPQRPDPCPEPEEGGKLGPKE